ncbi:MAG TPA: HEXXH motif-containing putative peptide modification protein [Candidatus Binataceae bacterium]|nr:HEXXH motif-containing putative peptide modification protein [Candidatus Binataceae bacterium]
MSPKGLLWADSEGYQRRLEKSSLALIAVQRVLAADGKIAGGVNEFLRLYEWVAGAAPKHFTQVWSDPSAYFWVRRAMHFLAACRGEPLGTVEREYCEELNLDSPAQALEYHLHDFKRFVLGLAIVAGSDVAFDELYAAALPMAIPGTSYVLCGEGIAYVAGLSRGAVQVRDPHRELSVANAGDLRDRGPHLERCPFIERDEVGVYLNPAMFRLPGLGIPREWSKLPLAFQVEHAPLVKEALEAVRKFQPMTFEHLAAGLHTIALKPHDDTFINVTVSELPGAFVCTVPADPYVLASSFIHEFHHNTLFALEERGPFFASSEEDEIEGENHYSPWVETLRPLHGILHAVYVFIPVYRFWSAALRDGSLNESRAGFAREQLARIPVQLQIGINQLRRHAKLTPYGAEIVDTLAAETAEVRDDARVLGMTPATPAMGLTRGGEMRPLIRAGRRMTVGDMLLEHLDTCDTLGECSAERAELARGESLTDSCLH